MFGAQDERIRLYKQQMEAVQKHQFDVRRGLIDQLEENHKQIQQRLSREIEGR